MKVLPVNPLVFPYFNYRYVVKSDLTVDFEKGLHRPKSLNVFSLSLALNKNIMFYPFKKKMPVLMLGEIIQYHIFFQLKLF